MTINDTQRELINKLMEATNDEKIWWQKQRITYAVYSLSCTYGYLSFKLYYACDSVGLNVYKDIINLRVSKSLLDVAEITLAEKQDENFELLVSLYDTAIRIIEKDEPTQEETMREIINQLP